MQLALTFVFILVCGCGHALNQDTRDKLEELLSPFLPYETASTTDPSESDISKCGEGSTRGKKICVRYEYCDGRTNTVVLNAFTSGFDVINVRSGEKRCDHPLEVCCKVPEGGLPSDFYPHAKPSTTSAPPTSSSTSTTPPSTPNYSGRNEKSIDFKITSNKNNEAEYGEFPWMVALIKKLSNPSDLMMKASPSVEVVRFERVFYPSTWFQQQ